MFTLSPHQYQVVKGRAHVHKFVPYMRLAKKDEEVFLQAGKIFDRSGKTRQPPSWLAEEMQKCDPKRLAEVGFKIGEEKEEAKEEPKPVSPAVQQLIEEHCLDVKDIEGSGKNGRILKEDVLKLIDKD